MVDERATYPQLTDSPANHVHDGISRTKTIIFWIVLILALFALLELVCYTILSSAIPSRIKARVGNSSAELRVAKRLEPPPAAPRIIQLPQDPDSGGLKTSGFMMFDPKFGWDYPPNIVYQLTGPETYSHGPLGERISPESYKTTLMATYGDSFTYGAEVNDDQTWQAFLAHKLQSNILNFGVGGYGTDQALLKYQMHNTIVTKIVMLGIFPENINRVVNTYRPLYSHGESHSLTKPRFIQDGYEFRLLPNLLTKPEDLDKLLDPEFVKELGQMDYWYQADQKLPALSFPYTISLFQYRKPVFEQISLNASRVFRLNTRPSFPWNLYNEPEPFAIMCYIVDSFVKTAHDRGSVPVIVILPHKDQVQELLDYGVSRFEPLTDYMKQKGYHFIDLVQAVASLKPDRSQLDQWYQGHATSEGNRVAADLIAKYFEKNPEFLR